MDEKLPFHCDEDLACTFLQHQLEFVDTFYSRKGVFRCLPVDSGDAEINITIHHLLGDHASQKKLRELEAALGRDLSPSHRAFLSRWNGCTLFLQENAPHAHAGIRLYSAEELANQHGQTLAMHRDPGIRQLKQPNLLIIGEMLGSGTHFALDGTLMDDGESPVVLLDHEALSMESDEQRVLAPAVTDLLIRIMASPIAFLRAVGGIRYHDGPRECVPEEFRLV